MSEIIKYPNGLQVVVETMDCIRSVVAGIWVRAGSAYENENENGIAHFIEHMTFKGTKTKNAHEISLAFDNMGALVNAFTSREHTCYYFKSIDDNCEECFKNLCDIFINSTFPKKELERERKVVIEEIRMSEDDGDGLCYDLIQSLLYDKHPLGKTILGSIDNIEGFTANDIHKFRDRLYVSENTIISFSGNITKEQADSFVKKYLLPYYNSDTLKPEAIPQYRKQNSDSKIKVKDFEQSSIFLAFPSVCCNDKNFTTQSVMDIILGNGMSSRLFQRLREKMGLVYSIYTTPMTSSFNGAYGVCMNINPKNTEIAIKAVFDELNILLDKGIKDEEINKAKTQLKVSALFGKENPLNYMMSMGRWLMMADRLYDINDTIKRIDSVSKDSIEVFAQNLFSNPVFCAYVGKDINLDLQKIIKEAHNG